MLVWAFCIRERQRLEVETSDQDNTNGQEDYRPDDNSAGQRLATAADWADAFQSKAEGRGGAQCKGRRGGQDFTGQRHCTEQGHAEKVPQTATALAGESLSLERFSSEVGTGSREENASKQESRASVRIESEPKLHLRTKRKGQLMKIRSHSESHIVELDDGSRWQIFPGDIDLTLDWKPETDLAVVPNDDDISTHRLIGNGVTVRVIAAGESWPVQQVRRALRDG